MVFGDELHRYTIADGIRDKNVLDFDPSMVMTHRDRDLREIQGKVIVTKVSYLDETLFLELTCNRIYDVLSVENGWYWIIDDGGEGYLYAPNEFEIVERSGLIARRGDAGEFAVADRDVVAGLGRAPAVEPVDGGDLVGGKRQRKPREVRRDALRLRAAGQRHDAVRDEPREDGLAGVGAVCVGDLREHRVAQAEAAPERRPRLDDDAPLAAGSRKVALLEIGV